jgi:hypothetical protein
LGFCVDEIEKSGLLSGFWKGGILISTTPLDRPAGSSVKSLDIAFMVANAVGIVLYLRLASRGWRIPQEHGMVPVTGEPFVWALALPVLGVFFLADIIYGEACSYAVGSPREGCGGLSLRRCGYSQSV